MVLSGPHLSHLLRFTRATLVDQKEIKRPFSGLPVEECNLTSCVQSVATTPASPCLQEHFPPLLSESRKASSQVWHHRPERPEGPWGSRLPSAPAGTRPLPRNATTLALGVSIPGAEAGRGNKTLEVPAPGPGGRSAAEPRAEVPPPLLVFSSPFPSLHPSRRLCGGPPGPARVDPVQDPPACLPDRERCCRVCGVLAERTPPEPEAKDRQERPAPAAAGSPPHRTGLQRGPVRTPCSGCCQETGLGRCCVAASLLLPNKVT